MINIVLHKITNKKTFGNDFEWLRDYLPGSEEGGYSWYDEKTISDPDVLSLYSVLYPDGANFDFYASSYAAIMNQFPEYEKKFGEGWNQKTYIVGTNRTIPVPSEFKKVDFSEIAGLLLTNTSFKRLANKLGLFNSFVEARSDEEKVAIALTVFGLSY